MPNTPQTINDLEFNKFLEIAGKVGIRVLITHGDGWLPPVTNLAALPPTGNTLGDIRMALDTGIPYIWNGTAWVVWSWASAAWGGISGTLANQSDLQTALNGKMSAGAYVLTSRDSLLANQVNLGTQTTGMLKVTTAAGIATFSTIDPANWDVAYTHSTLTNNPHSVTKAQVGLGNVDNTSDVNKPVSTAQAAADTTVLNSAKAYADSLVVGLVDDRGNYDASGNAFPSTGGSGSAGAVLKGDLWTVSVAGTLGGKAVTPGDLVRALVDTPGQTSSNWAVTENNIGYVAENQANKVLAVVGNETSNTVYASVKAIYDWANPLITARALDSAVVHLAGAETITGNKTFTGKFGINIFDGGDNFLNFRPQLAAGSEYNLSIGAYDHSGDSDRDGLSINASDGISFCTGANTRNERVRITGAGRFGILTTNPLYDFHVNSFPGSGGISGAIGRVLFVDENTGGLPGGISTGSTGYGLGIYSPGGDFSVFTNGTTFAERRLKISQAGVFTFAEHTVQPFYGPLHKLTQDSGFSYKWKSAADAMIMEVSPTFVAANKQFIRSYVTDTGANQLRIASRYELSGIAHASKGHIVQIIWGDSLGDAEGTGNDGGWGLEFGAHGNPYIKMIANDIFIGRSGGQVAMQNLPTGSAPSGCLYVDASGFVKRQP